MTVYVDDANLPFRGMVMCHMASDDLEELHAMAKKIGLKEEWFQDGRVPHYGISLSVKEKALKAGAIEVNSRALLLVMFRSFDGGDGDASE